ncbi:thiamine pyrophosphate-dependent dehydrogenase E1 component subunit alpha [Zavarzinella formosa]|uniref:thiamine pyrophosphate-dependent dehydrogenase E1 component subunit alpha n=1 Tax=Zavarzinella formosa TaxID=360055 RepID=UPI00030951D2|nr:thiamine pyrophosphate-dependent dehydrogenase E1 component subunit alpha [Zavarzinella formosa]
MPASDIPPNHRDDEERSVAYGVKPSRFVESGGEILDAERCLEIYRLMVRTRALEERTIKMSKSGEGYFWVGGPGEEAVNVCLGLMIKKGQGPAFDYLHLHYRNAGLLLAMGMPMVDHMRQMAMTATDRHSMGRNFVGHYAIAAWNVVPVTSVIEVQYTMAIGTAMVQKRFESDGVSVAVGGDAGTAQGDFSSCMIWASRPGQEVPVLMLVTNNGYGISTPAHTQHSEEHISDRATPFGIRSDNVNGNDPVATWRALERAFNYCRRSRRPYMLEAAVSRLHGHSSSSGAARVGGEPDVVKIFEDQLIGSGILHRELAEMIRHDAAEEADAAAEQVATEPRPLPSDVEKHTYAPSPVDAIYPDDYTGLPR